MLQTGWVRLVIYSATALRTPRMVMFNDKQCPFFPALRETIRNTFGLVECLADLADTLTAAISTLRNQIATVQMKGRLLLFVVIHIGTFPQQ